MKCVLMNKNKEVLTAEYQSSLGVFTDIYNVIDIDFAPIILKNACQLNEDRHLNNFGIIRNVENLNWIETAPIFDTGQSLNILDYNDEELVINGDGRFFYDVDKFDTIINYIQNIKRFDLSKLDGICEEFDDLLHKYQNITKMTDRRIDKICTLLLSRINKLKKIIESK